MLMSTVVVLPTNARTASTRQVEEEEEAAEEQEEKEEFVSVGASLGSESPVRVALNVLFPASQRGPQKRTGSTRYCSSSTPCTRS